jgi:hypothetical protein
MPTRMRHWLRARLDGCFVLHDSVLKYGLDGRIIYMHPDAPKPR